jgi:hypothetical protein
MKVDPRAIALQGVGFGILAVATLGFHTSQTSYLPDSEIAVAGAGQEIRAAASAGAVLDAVPALVLAATTASTPSLGVDTKTVMSRATPRVIELASETTPLKPQILAGLVAGFSYTKTTISFASGRTLPPIGFEDLLTTSDSLTATGRPADGLAVLEVAQVSLGKNLTDTVFAGDTAAVVLDSATTGLSKNTDDAVSVVMTGQIVVQNYTTATYFEADYVGTARTLT